MGGAQRSVRLVLSDVDGTLVTPDKELTPRSIEAVRQLKENDILFALTSGRPPRGVSMLIEPLAITTPLSAFNGGVVVRPDLSIIEEHTIAQPLVEPIISVLEEAGLSVWIYQGAEWFVHDLDGPHVQREARACQFQPREVVSYEGRSSDLAKIVGVSDDPSLIARASTAMAANFGTQVAASSSQTYYLDVTHVDAIKGNVVTSLASYFGISTQEIACVGDAENDLSMFERSGFSIAMGNSSPDVQSRANAVTRTNADEGFAYALENFILGS